MSARAELVARVEASFARAFGRAPVLIVASPGRVNLIGEHTDYNDGFVLPCAIDRHTLVAIAPSAGSAARVVASDYGDAIDRFDTAASIARTGGWADYVRGCVDRLQAADHAIPGFDMAIAGDVPQGTGLSSSASLEVGVVTALSRLCYLGIAPADAALIAQAAENGFVGMNCGIMDQMIAACGVAGHAVRVDCRSLATAAQPLPTGVAVAIVNSRVERGLVGSAYNERRQQCEAAAAALGVAALRDADTAMLDAAAARMDDVTFRRARHVVTENARVLAMGAALSRDDLAEAGALLRASHVSMRDDFEITVPAIDRLVGIANAAIGATGGARMTGGGFGGCVVALLPADRVTELAAAIKRDYRAPSGAAAELFVCKAADGAAILT